MPHRADTPPGSASPTGLVTAVMARSAAPRDEYHDPAGAAHRPTIPVAVHLLDGESGIVQRIGQLCQAAKAQLATRDDKFTSAGEDVVALEANPAIPRTDQLQPALHRPVGRIDPLERGVAVPPLPRPVVGVAALESQVAAGSQSGVDGTQGSGPLGVVEEHLGHIAGHDHQVGLWRPQGANVAFYSPDSVCAP